MQKANPYSSPKAQELIENSVTPKYARRIRRLIAVSLDIMIYFICILPAIISKLVNQEDSKETAFFITIVVMVVSILFLINLVMLWKKGQTIGKKIMKIKIVDEETCKHAGVGRTIGMRYILFSMLSSIPYVGIVVATVNPFFIFSNSNQCLHDKLARTIVINC